MDHQAGGCFYLFPCCDSRLRRIRIRRLYVSGSCQLGTLIPTFLFYVPRRRAAWLGSRLGMFDAWRDPLLSKKLMCTYHAYLCARSGDWSEETTER